MYIDRFADHCKLSGARKFREYWYVNWEKNPDMFPLHLPLEEWINQFYAFILIQG